MEFKDLELLQEFTHNGNNYIKNSDRTAKMLSNSKVNYFATLADARISGSKVVYFASYTIIHVYKVSK